jgi:hypothetical protein
LTIYYFFGLQLETLPTFSEQEKEEIQTLAVQIFTVHSPRDPAPLVDAYAASLDLGRSFHACTITGRYYLKVIFSSCSD